MRSLQAKGHGYSVADRRALVELISEVLGGIAERYRKLAKSGRVELSVTPYAHPIMPLLVEMDSCQGGPAEGGDAAVGRLSRR